MTLEAPALPATRLGVAAAFDGEKLVPGDVTVSGGRIVELGVEPAVGELVAAPGFVDLQLNGFAGVDFLTADAASHRRAATAVAASGVTAYQPTLISADVETLERAVATAAAAEDGHEAARVLPVHLEGPFLSPAWPGAHPREALLEPDPAVAERLLAAGPVGMVTLAPERPGGLELVALLRAAGVVVSIGHSDATAAQATAAFDAGARSLTHAFNAHRRLAGRDPGPLGVALTRDDVWITVIADGVHLAAETVRLLHGAAGRRLVAVSDAMAAVGLGDGEYPFGQLTVTVADGRATLRDGRLAGSVAPLDECLRELVRCGVPQAAALAAVTARPAAVLGRDDLGRLAPGLPADVVLLDRELRPVRTLRAGRTVFER